MKDQKKQIVEALTKKHIETVKIAKLSSVSGGGHDSADVLIICG